HAGNRMMTYVEPGQTLNTELTITPGFISGRDVVHDTRFFLFVRDTPAAGDWQPLRIRLTERGLDGVDPSLVPQPGTLEPQTLDFDGCASTGWGKVRVEIVNTLSVRASIWILQVPPSPGGVAILRFRRSLSGQRLLTSQTFRDLFRSETVQADEGINVR